MGNIFKAYDVRGIYPDELNKEIASKIGAATVRVLKAKTLVVGEDARVSSPFLRGAVVDAITKLGCNVFYIGECTTPLFYYSVNKLNADGGIMVTASHNPPQYGGLKIVGVQSRPIGIETGLREIEKLAKENLEPARDEGTIEELSFVDDYVDFVIEKSGVKSDKLNYLKLVVDAGNGMTGLVLEPLFHKLDLKPTKLFLEVDCNFPNRSPNVLDERALDKLRNKVRQVRADLGIAFDGDGDRVIFIDKNGETIRSYYILALMFKTRSSWLKKPKVVYDTDFTRSVKELFGPNGVRSRRGHTFFKQAMKDGNADFGGEFSGHFFFKEMANAESSMLTMLLVLKVLSESGQSMDDLIKPFERYSHSGEINFHLQSHEEGGIIMKKLKSKYKDGKVDELDGLAIDFPDWWFHVRPSNTEPLLRLVVEAKTKEFMEDKVLELSNLIKNG